LTAYCIFDAHGTENSKTANKILCVINWMYNHPSCIDNRVGRITAVQRFWDSGPQCHL